MSHVLKYFKVEEEPKHKLPNNFVTGFLEVSLIKMLLHWEDVEN